MSVTWRTVSAPNQSAANNLASRGIETILGSLKGVGETLKQPKKEEEAAKKEALRQALQLTQLDQGQQRIDASVNQNAANNEFREEGRDIQAEQFNRQLEAAQDQAAAKARAADVLFNRQLARDDRQAANALALQKSKDAAALKRTQTKSENSKGSGINLMKSFDQEIKDDPGAFEVEDVKSIRSLINTLTQRDDLSTGEKAAIVDYAKTNTGGLFGLNPGANSLAGEAIDNQRSPASIDKFINLALVNQPAVKRKQSKEDKEVTPAGQAALDIIRPQPK